MMVEFEANLGPVNSSTLRPRGKVAVVMGVGCAFIGDKSRLRQFSNSPSVSKRATSTNKVRIRESVNC